MPSSATARLMLTPEEAAGALKISRTRIYTLMGSGEIESVKIGRSRRIPQTALGEYVERLRTESRAAVA